MLTLPSVFASGALFQQCAPLTLHGQTEPGTLVHAALTHGTEAPFSAADTTADTEGKFALTLSCPAASMETWTITITAGADSRILDNVLFGELWLASGQSNMEMPNEFQPTKDAFLAEMTDRTLRVYHVDYLPEGGGGSFPYEPSDATTGQWQDITATALWEHVSAAGTAFVKEVYDYLRATGREMPVGFANASWGGTGMPTWLPRFAIDGDAALKERMQKIGAYPDKDNWNGRGDLNFQQPTCQYNLKIAPLVGLKFRGVLWYQGENECGGEPTWRIYRDYLYLYHRTYKALFAADEHFPMLNVLLYPWAYSKGDCFLGYLNQAFIDAARAEPENFYCAPISDLPPVWAFAGNHPIHPANKYAVGKRLGMLAETAVYGKAGQKQPAAMDGYRVEGNKLYVHFSVPGQAEPLDAAHGIRVNTDTGAKRPIGLYICGENGTYVPATCEIVSPDTIALSHPGIAQPKHAVYGYNSMEEGSGLWAGDYPLSSFRTNDKQWNADHTDELLHIEAKPWCDPTRTSIWAQHLRPDCGELLDVFYHPIWHPCTGCEVAHDRAFTLEDGSIRIALREDEYTPTTRSATIGACVYAHPYNRLDLQNYHSLHLRLLNHEHTTLSLVLVYKEENGLTVTKTIPAEKGDILPAGWATYTIPLDGIPDGEIRQMQFVAKLQDTPYLFVNLEGFVLMPKA